MKHASTPTLPSLTGMRWFAALLVFGLHIRNFGYFTGSAAGTASWAFGAGAVGVSFFFVLSGFVLGWSARPGEKAVVFWRRRFARIYPVHLLTALGALALALTLEPAARPTDRELAGNLLLVHSWRHDWWQTLDTVSWSLSCEAFFYAVFPLVDRGLRRLHVRGAHAVAGACVVLVMVLPWVNHHLTPALSYYSAPWARLPEFVLGAALARIVRLGRWRGPGLDVALAVSLIGYFACSQASPGYDWSVCTLPGFALLIPTAAVADLRAEPSFWRRPALVALGELSFAFYMVHLLVLRLATHLPGMYRPHPLWQQITLAVAAFTVALAVAWLVLHAVERAARRLLLPRPDRGVHSSAAEPVTSAP